MWKEYLYNSGLLGNASQEEIAFIRAEFQKNNKGNWQQEHRKLIARFEVRFKKIEEEELRAVAKANNMTVPQFLKLCYYACIYNYWESPNSVKIEKLLVAQNRIGNNINQLIRESYRTGIEKESVGAIHTGQLEIKKAIEDLKIKEPITTRVQNAVHDRPETLALILDVLIDEVIKQPRILELFIKMLFQKAPKLLRNIVYRFIN